MQGTGRLTGLCFTFLRRFLGYHVVMALVVVLTAASLQAWWHVINPEAIRAYRLAFQLHADEALTCIPLCTELMVHRPWPWLYVGVSAVVLCWAFLSVIALSPRVSAVGSALMLAGMVLLCALHGMALIAPLLPLGP